MTVKVEVGVEGLKEFNRALRKMGGELPKGTRLAFNEAARLVVEDAKPKVDHLTGKAEKSVRVSSTRTRARISGGSARAPYYGWLDFGGRVGKYRQVVRVFKKEGRFIYAAYFPLRDSGRFEQVLDEQLRALAEQAGLDLEQ